MELIFISIGLGLALLVVVSLNRIEFMRNRRKMIREHKRRKQKMLERYLAYEQWKKSLIDTSSHE
jgi:hypothetical protein